MDTCKIAVCFTNRRSNPCSPDRRMDHLVPAIQPSNIYPRGTPLKNLEVDFVIGKRIGSARTTPKCQLPR